MPSLLGETPCQTDLWVGKGYPLWREGRARGNRDHLPVLAGVSDRRASYSSPRRHHDRPEPSRHSAFVGSGGLPNRHAEQRGDSKREHACASWSTGVRRSFMTCHL